MSQIVFTKARLLPLLLLIVPSVGSLVPYYVAVRLGHVKPFLPFLSHAGGFPPQGAVFTSLIEVTAVLGVLTSFLRYAVVKKRRSLVPKNTVNKLNRIALWTGCFAFLGLLYLAVNPIGFPAPDKQDYMWNVFAAHNIGAFCALICFNIYILIQSYLTYNQSQIYKSNAVTHILLSVPIVISSVILSGIFYFVVADVVALTVTLKTGFVTLPNIQYPFFPLIAAFLEWIIVFFIFVYFATFWTDFKYVRIVFQLQRKLVTRKDRNAALSHTPSKNGRSCSFDETVSCENEKKSQ